MIDKQTGQSKTELKQKIKDALIKFDMLWTIISAKPTEDGRKAIEDHVDLIKEYGELYIESSKRFSGQLFPFVKPGLIKN